ADAESQGQARLLFARASERLGALDSARAAYAAASSGLAPIRDWLLLREAALTPDSSSRARLYADLRIAPARQRATYAEAQLLERIGRVRGAIALYDHADAPMQAMRLRAAVASGPVARESARRRLVAFVEAHSGTEDARFAIEMLDAGRYTLTADEEIVIARSAAEHGPLSRAREGLARAFALRAPSAAERILQAAVLAESGPSGRREAERILARIRKSSPLAGQAALERARLIRRRGRGAAAKLLFRAVVRLHPSDTVAAASALLMLAEMATDERRDAAARDAYLTLARRFPTSEHAPRARFDAAILAFAGGKRRVAAAELDSLSRVYPAGEDASAARYWAARSRAEVGDSAGARRRWLALLAGDSMSYYAALAAHRLGITPWAPVASPDSFARIADVDAAFARADLLDHLGMGLEERLELDALAAAADSSLERTLTIADGFRARGHMRRAIELGRRALALGATDARAWRLVYPVGDADVLAMESAKRKVDPALVAAVIRQESRFESWATSPAGARGLMQVMPRVGKALAHAEKITPWDPSLLYDADVNIRLGVLHLRSFTGNYAHPAMALAAYNAGETRVARWRRRPGGKDVELFVERIRFTETRGYVRTVLRSRDMYAALYDWRRIGAEAVPLRETTPLPPALPGIPERSSPPTPRRTGSSAPR
nr:transglycosylase SLT domain-containing protein [Gemmatimonadota bacterium]